MKWFIAVLLAVLAGCATHQGPVRTTSPPVTGMTNPVSPLIESTPTAAAQSPPVEVPTIPPPIGSVPVRAPTLNEFADRNDIRLLEVYNGMTKKAVERIMEWHHADVWKNPYKRQTLHVADGKVYEVFFYLTRPHSKGHPITEKQLTPVIFNDGRVSAIGRYQLKKLRQREGH